MCGKSTADQCFCFGYIWAASWENQQSAYVKTKTQISFAVTAKLISAFVFATWIVQYLYFLNTKFQASSHLQRLHSLVCVRPGQNPHCWFSHVAAHIVHTIYFLNPTIKPPAIFCACFETPKDRFSHKAADAVFVA